MADEFETAGSPPRKRAPSMLLLLAGILALVVSGWALAGGNGWPTDGVGGPQLGWVLVIAAIVVGAMLVFAPGKR